MRPFEMRARLFTIGTIAASTLALTACSHAVRTAPAKTGTATFGVFIPQGAQGFKLPRNEAIVLGAAFRQDEPVYPRQLLHKNVPTQSVCLHLAINEDGAVYMEDPLYGIPGCPPTASAVQPAFVEASVAAAKGWQFLPTLLCTFPNGTDAHNRPCPAPDAKMHPLAISLAFVFTFTQTNGKPSVRTDAL